MTPLWDLRLGDCLDPLTGLASLGDKSVDHVITDPPYSRDLYLKFRSNKAGGSSAGKEKASRPGGNKGPTAAYLALANEAIGAAEDVAPGCVEQWRRVVSRWSVVFHDAESKEAWRVLFRDMHVRCGVWVKTNPMPQVSGDRPSQGFESIEIAHPEGKKRWNGGGHAAVWTFGAVQGTWGEKEGNDHPCPKPLALMEKLIRDFSDPGDLILDPFAGSGTTGVAAIRLGRRFIGWEKDPKYHAIALKRLTAAREQLELCA
jgi:site-specific DNA-methyltransferase (adenine-specific)